MRVWLSGPLVRYYPASQAEERSELTLHITRGEQASFQVVFRTDESFGKVTAAASTAGGLDVRVRRVGYVPMPHLNTGTPISEIEGAEHLPGYVPDPLFPDSVIDAGPYETNAFWITVRAPKDIEPGTQPVTITLEHEGNDKMSVTADVVVHQAQIQPRQDFPVTHWFYADSLCDWYGVEPFEESFWKIVRPYFADIVSHGQDTVYVPMFTPPLDGVKRPTQLLGVRRSEKGDYKFDWDLVRRWITTAREEGVTRLEWTHLFTQWGAKHAIRIYEGQGGSDKLLWDPETGATSPTYRRFLSQFLPEFKRFLDQEGLMDQSIFHLSDEPHGDEHLANYRAARDLLRELAPWMKVTDALSDIRFAREGLVDFPVPSISVTPEFVKEGFAPRTYFCCGPRGRYLNRLLDTPLAKIRMSGWLFYRTKVTGFLHWGYNYWYQSQTRNMVDPYTVTDGKAWPGWAYGDTMMVYPGPDGPIDSLRWEVFAESLQDYALLQTAGIDPDDPMLSDIHDYADFPKSEDWIINRRRRVLKVLGS